MQSKLELLSAIAVTIVVIIVTVTTTVRNENPLRNPEQSTDVLRYA